MFDLIIGWHHRQIIAPRHKENILSRIDARKQLYDIYKGVKDDVDSEVGIASILSLNYLFELDKVHVNELQ